MEFSECYEIIARCGFTTVGFDHEMNCFIITHGGNMGNSIKNVNYNLSVLEMRTIEELKNTAQEYIERGSPDYYYEFQFRMKQE